MNQVKRNASDRSCFRMKRRVKNCDNQRHTYCSWAWKRLLRLRYVYQQHFRWRIGNGKAVSFWFDPWHPNGPLNILFSNLEIYRSGIPRDASVADALSTPLGWYVINVRANWWIPYLSLINKKTVSNGYGIHRGNSQRRLLGISSDPKEMWCLGLRLCGAHPCRRDTKPTYGLLPVTGCQLRFFSSHLR